MAKKARKNIAAQTSPYVREKEYRKWTWSIAGFVFLASLVLYLTYPTYPQFDGLKAYQYLEEQCAFGPRVPGNNAHQRCGDYLTELLKQSADKVQTQWFEYRDRKDSTRVFRGRNIIASYNLQPKKKYRVLLCAHWDSRPFADQEKDAALRSQPVLGANDGASGVAVLLEMARIFRQYPLEFGVDIVLFDLEDIGDIGAGLNGDTLNPFCIGSQYFVENAGNYQPQYGILLDMIGDKSLTIKREGYSQANAPVVMNKIWRAAREVGARAFVDEPGEALIDDHIPFLQKGIPVVDLIDFDYAYWHTVADTPDKCSPKSLQQVGDVLIKLLYQTEKIN
jgi:hypothetical protein